MGLPPGRRGGRSGGTGRAFGGRKRAQEVLVLVGNHGVGRCGGDVGFDRRLGRARRNPADEDVGFGRLHRLDAGFHQPVARRHLPGRGDFFWIDQTLVGLAHTRAGPEPCRRGSLAAALCAGSRPRLLSRRRPWQAVQRREAEDPAKNVRAAVGNPRRGGTSGPRPAERGPRRDPAAEAASTSASLRWTYSSPGGSLPAVDLGRTAGSRPACRVRSPARSWPPFRGAGRGRQVQLPPASAFPP